MGIRSLVIASVYPRSTLTSPMGSLTMRSLYLLIPFAIRKAFCVKVGIFLRRFRIVSHPFCGFSTFPISLPSTSTAHTIHLFHIQIHKVCLILRKTNTFRKSERTKVCISPETFSLSQNRTKRLSGADPLSYGTGTENHAALTENACLNLPTCAAVRCKIASFVITSSCRQCIGISGKHIGASVQMRCRAP